MFWPTNIVLTIIKIDKPLKKADTRISLSYLPSRWHYLSELDYNSIEHAYLCDFVGSPAVCHPDSDDM